MSEHPSYQDPNLINERKVKMWSHVAKGKRGENSQDALKEDGDGGHYQEPRGQQAGARNPEITNAYHESYFMTELGATVPR